MYAKNQPAAPKYDFPFQEQQRYSGSFVVKPKTQESQKLSDDTIRAIEESARKLVDAEV